MTAEIFRSRLFLLSSVVAAFAFTPAAAAPVALATELVFDGAASGDGVSAPRLGSDGSGNYVVFQLNDIGPFGVGPGAVVFQRLTSAGASSGAPQVISRNVSNETAPDGSGQYVVYVSDDDFDGQGDAVRLIDLSTSSDFLVADGLSGAGPISDVRISGERIAWNQGDIIFFTQVTTIGTGVPPTVVRGPVPASSATEIDSRFIVWTEQVAGFDMETRAQEIGGASFFVTSDDLSDGFNEITPATFGDLIAFGLVDNATGLADIVLRDIAAATMTTFLLGLEGLSALSLSQDFLAFNALDAGGVSQAFILSLLDGGVLQLTNGQNGGGVSDVFGDFVAYTSGDQLFVAELGEGVAEIPVPPAFALFGLGLAGLAASRRRRAASGLEKGI
ncbi:hypothetical protein ACFOOP_10965 [Marinicaulis aureus]|uniref:PEP-CTERM protein-sorting domain-containing protein n=1 Tax=Hyphococcus aureus TaxID=2666033 RepID=A0ABW1L2V4_9PROT